MGSRGNVKSLTRCISEPPKVSPAFLMGLFGRVTMVLMSGWKLGSGGRTPREFIIREPR